MSTVLVVAPHPDDETLGCGGTILRHVEQGDSVYWLIVTHISQDLGFSKDRVDQRDREIEQVASRYKISRTINLEFPANRLDTQPMATLVEAVGEVVSEIEPELMYLPYRNDIHTDHAVVFDAVASCSKWFRYPSVRRVLAYETPSETDFALDPDAEAFRPTVFMDITGYLEEKIEIMRIYKSEMGTHPFPRSASSIRSLATLRGAAAGMDAAEAFVLLREINK
jgi:LmbE family N-acetylglucosaminyl deacetylase